MNTVNRTPPTPSEAELIDTLLSLGLADALDAPPHTDTALRSRLTQRLSRSVREHAHLQTVRRLAGAPGELQRQALHRAAPARRPGEAECIEWLQLPAGTAITWLPASGPGSAAAVLELLVVRGQVAVDDLCLESEDFVRQPWQATGVVLQAAVDSQVYLRLGRAEADADETRCLSRADAAVWEGDPTSIERRLLWQHGTQAAVLVRARAGAQAPDHGHRLDEECFMVRGDLFTGDVLLCEGDFQLAPAGGPHAGIEARTELLLYLRGDAEMAVDLVADALG